MQPKTPLFTSDSQHPPRFGHVVYLGVQLSTDSKFCMQLGIPISMPATRAAFIGRLYFIYQSIGQIISFQMMPPQRSFDDLDGKEQGQKKTDDLRAMTTLGPCTLPQSRNANLKAASDCLIDKSLLKCLVVNDNVNNVNHMMSLIYVKL